MSSSGVPTPKIRLNQWQSSDKPERTDFNGDNLKIDTAFAGVYTQLGEKANQEIGNWTPVLTGIATPGKFTYSRQYGKYAKVGNIVTITCDIAISNVVQVPVGDVILTGLPFATTWIDQPATVGYAKGGYGESMRKMTQGSIVNSRILMRGVTEHAYEDDQLIIGLIGMSFGDSATGNGIKINAGTNDIALLLGATYYV